MQPGQQLHQRYGARGTDGVAACQPATPSVDARGIQPLGLQGLLEGQTLYGKGVMQLDGVQDIQVQPLPLQQGLRRGQCAGQRVVRIGAQAEPAQPRP